MQTKELKGAIIQLFLNTTNKFRVLLGIRNTVDKFKEELKLNINYLENNQNLKKAINIQ